MKRYFEAVNTNTNIRFTRTPPGLRERLPLSPLTKIDEQDSEKTSRRLLQKLASFMPPLPPS